MNKTEIIWKNQYYIINIQRECESNQKLTNEMCAIRIASPVSEHFVVHFS